MRVRQVSKSATIRTFSNDNRRRDIASRKHGQPDARADGVRGATDGGRFEGNGNNETLAIESESEANYKTPDNFYSDDEGLWLDVDDAAAEDQIDDQEMPTLHMTREESREERRIKKFQESIFGTMEEEKAGDSSILSAPTEFVDYQICLGIPSPTSPADINSYNNRKGPASQDLRRDYKLQVLAESNGAPTSAGKARASASALSRPLKHQ